MSGTPCYIAPELITDLEKGEKGAQDIWALGCLLYEMILGREPWDEVDNIYSLYYILGVWASRAREMHSEANLSDSTEPLQMLRDSSCLNYILDSDEIIIDHENRVLGSSKHNAGSCGIIDCINNVEGLCNPLLSIATASKLFSEEALDFMNLTLQWMVCLLLT